MATAVVGAARVVFGADTVDFDNKAKGVEGVLGRLQDKFEALESRLRRLGVGMTLGVTLPFAAMVRSVSRDAGSFEAAMKNVEAALDNVTGEQLKKLSDQARTLGPAVGKSATDAAGGIEQLGLAGVKTSDILGGALKSTLDLAAAGMVDVAPAAGLVTDVMGQFHKTAAQLPSVVAQVVGSLDQSKFGFDDFRLAVGQGGAVAASSGVQFNEFATAIAATSSQFTSGSDAGTSFRTYMQLLTGKSKEAEEAMKALGLSFYDANGKMKPLAEQAEAMKKAFAGLDPETKNKAITTIFGADAAKTAIGLMEQGREGFERYRAAVEKGDVSAKIAKRMEGDLAAGIRMKNAWESVKISLGDTGLLDAITGLKNGMARALESFAAAPPLILKVVAVFAGFAAAIGPMLFVLGNIAAIVLPLVAARFGIVGLAISALLNPAGTLAVVVARLISTFAGGMIIARVGAIIAGLLTPIGLVTLAVTALAYAWQMQGQRAAASAAEQDRLRTTMNGAKPALDKAAEAVANLTGKTGDAAKAAREHANAMLQEARAAVIAASAVAQKRVTVANAALAESRSYRKQANATTFGASGGAAAMATQFGADAMDDRARRARAEAKAAKDGVVEAKKQLGELYKTMNAPAPVMRKVDLSGDDSKKKKTGNSGGTGRNTEFDAANRSELELQAQLEAARLRNDQETVRAIEKRLDLERQIEAYQRTGLSLAEATKAANRDMKLIGDARATQTAKQIADDERSFQIRLAEISGNGKLEESLKRQEYLQERIEYWRKQGLATAQATAAATADQARLDAAVAAQREREAARADADRQIDLARARGDSEDSIRRMEAARDQARRSEDLQRGADGRAPMDKADADAQAATEAMQNEQARQTGIWRDTIKGGLRAAMDGNLGDYLKNWWKDRVAKGMEEALNSLSDLIQKLFSNIDLAGSGSGGGGLGGLLSGIGKLFGGSHVMSAQGGFSIDPGNGPVDIFTGARASGGIPGFATGGTFKVGGMAGIDRNLISFRATRGEMVDIRRPGQDAGAPQRVVIEPSKWFDVRAAEAAEPSIQNMGTRAADGGSSLAQQALGRRARQRLGR